MNIDLENMSLKDMQDLRGKLDRAIASYEDRKRRQALSDVEEAARKHGFNLADLTGAKPAKGGKTGSVAPKYANPQDPTMTWTGRGRKPRWVVDQLDAGKELADLAI